MYDAVGYVGVAAAVALETIVAPIPSEVILPMAGWKVSQSAADASVLEPLTGAGWSFLLAVAFATVGSLIGALVGYAIGAWAVGRCWTGTAATSASAPATSTGPIAGSSGGVRGPSSSGGWCPSVRTFVSYPAGIARMPLGRFILFSTLGSLPWNAALIGAGFVVGENYTQIEAALKPFEYLIYAVVIGLVVVVLVRWQLGKRRGQQVG